MCGKCEVSQQCYAGEIARCAFDTDTRAGAFAEDVRAILSPREALPYSECVGAIGVALGGRGAL